MPGRHAAGQRRSGHALMARAALAAASRVAAGIVRAAAWVTRVIVLPLLAALLEWAKPHLRRAWTGVRNFVLRHCNARDITVTVMIFAFPIASAVEYLGTRLPGSMWGTGTATATACGMLLWWLQYRAQRKWRRKGGEVIEGRRCSCERQVAENTARIDLLLEILADGYDYAGRPVPAELRPAGLHLVTEGGNAS